MHQYRAHISILVAFLLGFTGCGEVVLPHQVLVLGHGGGGFYAVQNPHPPNSRKSIEQAVLVSGADGVEVDVQLSRDGEVVLFHDRRLETSTNRVGYVSEFDLSDLMGMNYRGQIDPLADDRIIGLEETLELLTNASSGLWISLNLQTQREISDQAAYRLRFTEALVHALLPFQGRINVLIESPDRELLKVLLAQWPPAVAVEFFYDAASNPHNIEFANGLKLQGLVSNVHDETEESMELAKASGLEMVLYGLKIRTDVKRALEFAPRMIQADNIPLTLDYLNR